MKEFLKTKTVTYNLMSFTGFKALLLFSLLAESPKSYEEINEHFFNHPYLHEKISIDTLRVYINSLERIGCKIERTKKSQGAKYVLMNNPFEIKITDDQINSIAKVYKSISKNISVEDLMYLEKFFFKLASLVKNEKYTQTLEEISLLNNIDKKLLEELLHACKRKHSIIIKYNSPNSSIKNIEVKADKLEFTNSKLYLYGTSYEYNKYSSYLVSRIIEIVATEIKEHLETPEEIEVFYRTNLNKNEIALQENEEIVSIDETYTTIKIKNSNKFFITQRILSYGDSCEVISPQNYKDEIIATLKQMQEVYKND